MIGITITVIEMSNDENDDKMNGNKSHKYTSIRNCALENRNKNNSNRNGLITTTMMKYGYSDL